MIRTAETANGWVVGVGPFADHALGRCLRGERPAGVLSVPWRTSPPATPLQVLSWRSRSLPLIGRDEDAQVLLDWARSGPAVQIRTLVGDAGSGKSRLAAEVADTLQGEGWSAGFVTWSDGCVWRTGTAGTLLIVDDPLDAEGRWWRDLEDAMENIGDTSFAPAALRVLILSRDSWRRIDAAGSSVQDLHPLASDEATTIHYLSRRRFAPERPIAFPEQPFAEWAAADPSVRLQPLYAIAAGVSLGHAPWDEGYPADSREPIIRLARATHMLLDQDGARAGLTAGVVPFIAALAEVRGRLDDADLRSLVADTALTASDADQFVACVRQLPAWVDDSMRASADGLPQAEFVSQEFCGALERGLGIRVGGAMHTAYLRQVARLDRNLLDANVDDDLCDQLARAMPLADERWLVRLDVEPRRGSLLGRLALYAAERAAPPLPVLSVDEGTDELHAGRLMTLARQQYREKGPVAAVEAAEEGVSLYRNLTRRSVAYRLKLLAALYDLAICLQEAQSVHAGEVWKERVDNARSSPDPQDLEMSLLWLGNCEWAADEYRRTALQELAEINRAAGRENMLAVMLESQAALAPLDEAIELVHEAQGIRASLDATAWHPPSDLLDRLFARLKDADPSTALLVARLQVADRRRFDSTGRYESGTSLRLAERLENVAAVAGVDEARAALVEALALYRHLSERTRGQFGRVERQLRIVEERLRTLPGGVDPT